MVTKEKAREQVEEFLQLYKKHLAEGKFEGQKEANTEHYIEHLFEILGWDRYDLERQHTTTDGRVDYAVNLDGHPYCFIEVKRHSTKDLDQYKKQAIDYAWQAEIKWVILTNLREFRVYNAEYKGQPEEIMRVVEPIYLDKLLDRFSHLWWFSKEAAKENLIERETKLISKVKLKEPITVLSESLLRWRSLLTKDMKAHPKLNEISGLDKDAANEWVDESVQMLLNRFIFLRTIESLGQWTFSLREVRNRWRDNKRKHLMEYISEFFRDADTKYNAGLFAKHKCEDLHICDEILDKIIEELYVDKIHDVEWDFRALASDQDILGLAYEQYLGATLTEKTAKVKTSKKKRKKLGIYYTPKPVVNYIIENTLGEILKTTKDEDVTKLKILDPACGSGSFLKQAYRRLSKEIVKRGLEKQQFIKGYTSNDNFTVYDVALKECIRGVDLDKKAVEMAKLNMLIVGAEKGVHLLPNLDESIQKGNSLIDKFAITGKNAFVWEERFKDVFDQGKFDVIIGNPPYGADLNEVELDYLSKLKTSKLRNYDTYIFFIETCMNLLKEGGYFGFIIPDTFLRKSDLITLREVILSNFKVKIIAEVGAVFEDAKVTENVVFVFQKCSSEKARQTNQLIHCTLNKTLPREQRLELIARNAWESEGKISQKGWMKAPEMRLGRFNRPELLSIIEKIEAGESLGNIIEVDISRGSEGGKAQISNTKINGTYKPIVIPDDIWKYGLKFNERFFPIRDENNEKYTKKKIYVIRIRNTRLKDRIVAAYDDSGLFTLKTLQMIYSKDESKLNLNYLLGIINSNVTNFYCQHYLSDDINKKYLQGLKIIFSKKYQTELIELVNEITSLNKKFAEYGDKTTPETAKLNEEIQKVDVRINDIVYKIYGIEEEKKIIEKNLR